MRLLDLQLLRFGHFTDVVLDFESGDAGLQLIFGSNETGKSTTLRAIIGLLFGIPEATRDDHHHDKPELRIGARLENRSGERIQVVRRKGRKNTLLGADQSPLDDAVLNPFLGGMGRELFETLFGLSHETLIRGGHELLAGQGELGESLFSAGMGSQGIHAVRASLRAEAERIFAPRAQNPPLNRALKEFKEAKKNSDQLSLRPRDWQALQEELREAEAQLSELEQDYGQAQTELNRLQRLRRVLPQIHKRDEWLRRKAVLGEVALISDSCSELRSQAQHKLNIMDVQMQKLLDEQARRERERTALEVPEALLAWEAALEELRDRLGVYRQAMQDLPDIKARVVAAWEEAGAILRELGRDQSLEEVAQRRIDVATRERLQRLGKEGTRLETETFRIRKKMTELDERLTELRRQHDRLPPPRYADPLRRLLAEVRQQGDLEDQLRKLEAEIASLQEQAGRQLVALALWQGPLEQVAELPVPLAPTVERFRSRLEELAGQRRLAETRREDIYRQREDTARQIAELEGRGAVPTEQELQDARLRREACWRRLRTVWLEGAAEAAPTSLAGDYEHQVRYVDELADRLWHEADRAAKHATLHAEKRRHEAEIVRIDSHLEALAGQAAAVTEEWRELWHPAGIEPLPPTEMLGWLGRQERLKEAIEHWGERQCERDILREVIIGHRNRCGRELLSLDEPPSGAEETLAGLLRRADEVVARIAETEDLRRQLQRDLEQAEREWQSLRREMAGCEEALQDWRGRWRGAVQPLGLEADAGIEEADAVLNALLRLYRKVDDARKDQIRIDQISDYARNFAGRVVELSRECAPDLVDMAAAEAAAELGRRLKKGKNDLKDRDNLDQRLRQLLRELDDARRDREGAQTILSQLMADAGVHTLEELEAAERRSREYRDLAARVNDLEEQLLGEGIPIEELVRQALALDPDRLPAEISAFEERCGQLGEARDQCRERVWGLQSRLNAMDGRNQAALAAAEAQEALARIKVQVENYVRLKLSVLVLGREIERYRERNQGPVIRRASELFRRLTLGSFVEISTGFGADDSVILLCVRDNGQRVPVEGLSEGTRDQLYLVLRLASLERYLERNEPLPLIVDDILINFDDHRARATLELLGELSERTQVLFFTHHAHMVELAWEAVPTALLRAHNLDQVGRVSD